MREYPGHRRPAKALKYIRNLKIDKGERAVKIIKRNGSEVEFDITKIIVAITKANDTVEEADHIWKVFLSTYLNTQDAEFLAKAEAQVATFSCARYLFGLLRIPDLMKPEDMVRYKAKFSALYDKGIEPLCF